MLAKPMLAKPMLAKPMLRLVVLTAFVIVAGACGGDSGDNAGPTTSTTTTAPATSLTSTTTEAPVGDLVFDIAADDPAVQLVGRWDISDPAAPVARWAGASMSFRFNGTAVGVKLFSQGQEEWIRVVVDGDVLGARNLQLTGDDGIVPITLEPIFDELDAGWHTIEVIKETQFSNLIFRGFIATGTGETEPVDPLERRIVFYGDSNLAGHSLENERDQADPHLVGTYFGYAGITARMFAADFHNISWSGSTLSGVQAVFDAVDRAAPEETWELDRFPADLVVMNLGANDIYGTTPDAVKADYLSMLDTLRAGHPGAHIVVYNAYGWSIDEPANYTHELADLWDDDNFSVATFPWVFEQFHGTEYDHGGMAMVLADHIETVMGWKAAEQDVMSGFGRDGDVANGGFEEVAPFGGFGWRYVDDPNVERVVSDGDAYVELGDGASIHQPTPVGPGETVTVTAQVFGHSNGNIEMTVDFRDQQQWSDPLSSTTSAFSMPDEWTEISMEAIAPDDPAVFHTRVTFTAGDGSVVRLDDVVQTIR
ncbi:MAG: lysophospholipase L1-like esterase [Candidatus Aldehydirespiratoraceae bacterium]|jgi:lysophospholipase L1-like esterase